MDKTQSWTDDNVAKLVKQKQKEELEDVLVDLKTLKTNMEQIINCSHILSLEDDLNEIIRPIEKRLKELE